MNLRKKEFPRRRTEPGKVEWVTGIFFLLFLGILLGRERYTPHLLFDSRILPVPKYVPPFHRKTKKPKNV